ncbi:hypothetical protein GCM10023205_04410 [Yinghuangia aomiensis]|uniref:Secreted protein n=1 Tax=Yinghuangia aomiensis TaxID=676205 RepID=A0ABP9GLQ7_9ACTN
MARTRRRGLHARLEAAVRPPERGPANRVRLAIGAGTLALLTILAVVVTWLARPDDTTSTAAPAMPTPHSTATDPSAPGHAGPPKTRDALVYAKAFAEQLWSYDTRIGTQSGHLSALLGWLTSEAAYADPASVTAQIPDPVLWSRMRDGGQYATATVTEAHIPASFTAALNANPDRIATAYAYAVTVTGKQTIRWNGTGPGTAGSGAESRAVTLAVQCRPDRDCALVGVTPGIAP